MPTVFVSFLLGFTQPQLRSAEVCLARALKHLGRQDSLPKCSDATAIHAVQNTITDKIPRALKCLCKSAAGQCSSLRQPLRPQDGKAVCEKSTAPYKCGMARDGPQDILRRHVTPHFGAGLCRNHTSQLTRYVSPALVVILYRIQWMALGLVISKKS